MSEELEYIYGEIEKWQAELIEGDIEDDIIYQTLDVVKGIVMNA